MGVFGLAVGTASPTDATKPTLLSALFESGDVPSSTTSYTAGSISIDLSSISILGSTTVYWSAPTDSIILAFRIESLISQNWVPEEACTIFETAFGIQWDDNLQLYIVNETTHDKLAWEKPSVSFSIGASRSARHHNYTLPYTAFDLRLAAPLANTTTYNFPPKRAADPSQYVLGRAFLQETYITIEYERGNLSLSQAYPA
ncbi:hypothetical protein EK21DRAFT_109539 [Setomelanomma holmii]|uniref:Uncharacterized protein n=1 Tax=Setomelanomma holmii TaxID=210430 RepID=A0A9P4HDU4_9PLEO|nr:hypothetical protein EK21DRAFT_109539 [Setomelanomma holmii]